MKKRVYSSRRFISSFLLLLLVTFGAYAQNLVTGKVTDAKGEALPGVSVRIVGTNTGVHTNISGQYSIEAKNSDQLNFSFLGMKSVTIKVNKQRVINVVLSEDVASLNEVVVVGYGTQKRASITGAVSSVSDKELLRAPTMSISNIVGSRIAGVAAVQSSGQPGADNASLTMRGQSGIIYVIDGVRRTASDFNGLDPNEIASISILKDASAVAVYGLDANGAFIVTTKKGANDKMHITYTGTYGISKNAEQQEWLDGPSYAYWYNKALEMQGDPILFTKEVVEKMKNNQDGWGNTNWYDKVYGTGYKMHHNVSASGGSEKLRFFTSLGYFKNKGNINNFDYDRINLRSNINADITRDLSLFVGVSGRIEQHHAPRYSANPNDWHNISQQTIYAVPYVQETIEHEGQIYSVSTPTASSPVAPLASINESGYNNLDNTYIQSNFSLNYKVPFVKGLSLKFQGAYDKTFSFRKTLSIPYQVMIMDLPTRGSDVLRYHKGYDAPGSNVTLSESGSKGYTFTTQTSANYDFDLGKHKFDLLLLAETRENRSNALSASGTGLDFIQLDELSQITNLTSTGKEKYPTIGGYSGQTRVAGFVGRLNYNYDNRYYLEASLRHDGSYLFGGMNKRWVTLPGLSLGWRINKEDWFRADWVDNLKLRLGIGKTATSNGLRPFQWRNAMGLIKNAVVIGGASESMLYAKTLGNPYLRWSLCDNYNIGLDANFWNALLGLELDVFYKHEYDKLSQITGSYPPSRGGYYFSSGNVNECDYKGFELALTHNNKFGDFNYGMKLIWSYAYGRWIRFAGDSDNAPEYQRLTGKQIGAKYGFLSEGLFQSEEEIANSATIPGSPVAPGYVKYTDRNGDGVITAAQDQGYVGKSSRPTHTGSFNFFGNWRGFDFDVLMSWGLGSDVAMTGVYFNSIQDNTAYTKPFYHGGNAPAFLVENSWTPDNPGGTFPRLEIVNKSTNNAYSSTFWYKNGNYLRIKSAQLGYSLPKSIVQPLRMESLRIFVEGYNLLTFSGLTKYNIDPEAPAVNNGYYPQQRTVTMGVKVSF